MNPATCSRIALAIIASFFCLLGATSNANAGKRLALVIGNSAYVNEPLANPANDARAIARKLSSLGFDVSRHLQVERDDIGVITEGFLSNISPGDEVVFYYAGHGVQVDGQNYLLATDASIRSRFDVERNSINVGRFLDRLDATRAAVKIVFLDACRNNPFTRAFRGQSTRGLARIGGAPTGTLISFATQPGGVADDGKNGNGLYTSQLLEHMDTPGLPIEQMLKRVASSTSQRSGGQQRPWIEGSIVGEFVFRIQSDGPGHSGTASLALKSHRRPDIEGWMMARELNTRAGYEAYLKEFAGSEYARLARFRLATMPSKGPAKGPAKEAGSSSKPAMNSRPLPAKDQPDRMTENQKAWARWQRSLEQAYADAMSVPGQDQRILALSKFLKDYSAENPYDPNAYRLQREAERSIVALGTTEDDSGRITQKSTTAWPKPDSGTSAGDSQLISDALSGKIVLLRETLRAYTEAGNLDARFLLARQLYVKDYTHREHVSEAVGLIRHGVAARHADSLALFAHMHWHGNGVTKDIVAAKKFFDQAISMGSSRAKAALAYALVRYESPYKDIAGGIRTLEAMASSGSIHAQRMLGAIYFYGYGQAKDYDIARKWYSMAAAQGHAASRNTLGLIWAKGLGSASINESKAVGYFQDAADSGNAWGLNNLGMAYRRGYGHLSVNHEKAIELLRAAAKRGLDKAGENLSKYYPKARW